MTESGWRPEQIEALWNKGIDELKDPALISYGIKSFKPMGTSASYSGGIYYDGTSGHFSNDIEYSAVAPLRNKFSHVFRRIWNRSQPSFPSAAQMFYSYGGGAGGSGGYGAGGVAGLSSITYTTTVPTQTAAAGGLTPSIPQGATTSASKHYQDAMDFAMNMQAQNSGALSQAHMDKIRNAFLDGRLQVEQIEKRSDSRWFKPSTW